MTTKLLNSLSIGQRMATIPLLFCICAWSLVGIMIYQANVSSKSGAAINLAGRQRMLNQRVTREVLFSTPDTQDDYQKTLTLFSESLALLETGGDHKFGHIQPATDAELQKRLSAQQQKFAVQKDIISRLLEAKTETGENDEAVAKELVQHAAEMHTAAHSIVVRLAEASKEAQAKLLWTSTAIAFVVIALTCVWSYICGRSVIRQVAESATGVHQLSKVRLSNVSQTLRQNAATTSSQATIASGAAEEVSANAHSLTTAVEQFEQSIKEIASNASNAASISKQAVDATSSTNNTIGRLDESSSQISDVIKVIKSIAEQTNLLALNATIEAARAGEAGKGFAVVANEVKELAKETSKATEDIVQQVEAIQTDTQEAVGAIGLVNDVIAQINESQIAISGAVEEQSAVSSEISRNIQEVAVGSGEIAKNIAEVASTASVTATSSDETMETSDNIGHLASDLLAIVGTRTNQGLSTVSA